MDTLVQLNKAINYIEENLTNQIDYQEVVKIACCSEYHFTRMFSFLAGITLSEYIRRRRLTLAALELSQSNIKIIDAALKYGYNSPDSFSRAFHSMHGVNPSEARVHGQSLKAFPRMSFQLTIKGGNEMNYRIENKESFHIVGIKKRVPIIFQGVNPEIASMYEGLTPEMIDEMKRFSDVEPSGFISASTNFSEGRMEEKRRVRSLYWRCHYERRMEWLGSAGSGGLHVGCIHSRRLFSECATRDLGANIFGMGSVIGI